MFIEDTELPLSFIREDLELVSQSDDRTGTPYWTLFDPIRHRFFQLTWRSVELLRNWPVNGKPLTAQQLVTQTDIPEPDLDEVAALEKFLTNNQLTEVSSREGTEQLFQVNQRSNQTWWQWLVHNYLFLKISLINPDSKLRKVYPGVSWLFQTKVAVAVIATAIVSLYFLMRQWEEFSHTFVYFFNLQGLFGYAVALILVKVLHEIGHALTLTHYGGRVHSMGVAFIVMFPVLYTDTSDAWRLTSRRKRLFVGAAGMITELSIAAFATLLWTLLDDGVLRSMMFFLATTSWLSSLLVNLNPFMRFDGYYLLSDTLRIENLQTRAFAHGKAQLRRILFDLPMDEVDAQMKPLHPFLYSFAWLTWMYRFVVFLGIALLVYTFFFKALGIVVFLVEIIWFIALPIFREVATWWSRREEIMNRKRIRTSGVVLALAFLCFVFPWSTSVQVQGVLLNEHYKKIYAPVSGQVVSSHLIDGHKTLPGQPLLALASSETEMALALKQAELAVVNEKLKLSELDYRQRDSTASLRAQRKQHQVDIDGLLALRNKQEIVASAPATVRDIDPNLAVGRWVQEGKLLFTEVYDSPARIRAFATEQQVARLEVGQEAYFYPDNQPMQRLELRLTGIADAGSSKLNDPMLASIFGGDIAVRQEPDEALAPDTAIYELEFAPPEGKHAVLTSETRGMVHVDAKAQSFFRSSFSKTGAILRREFGI